MITKVIFHQENSICEPCTLKKLTFSQWLEWLDINRIQSITIYESCE